MLQKAQSASEKNTEATALEKLQVEVAGSYGLDGKIDLEQLKTNLKRINGLKYKNNELSDTNMIDELPAVVKLNDYMFEINEDGEVSLNFEMLLNYSNLSLEPEESEILTVTIAGEQEENITWTSDTPSVAMVENNGKVTAVAKGTAKITAIYRGKSVVCNVTVATKLVNIDNLVGKYVNINIGYIDQMDSTDYTTTNNIKNAWKVLSKDETTNTVNLISTGHPLKFFHPVKNASDSLVEMNKISTEIITVDSLNSRGYRGNGFSTNDIKGLFNNSNIFAGMQPARYSVSNVSINSQTLDSVKITGQKYWLGESYSSNALRCVNDNGTIASNGNETFGVRLVVTLVSGITTKDGAGTELSPYRINGINY